MPKNFSYPAKNSSLSSNKSAALSKATLESIRLALNEDIGSADITSKLLIPSFAKGKAVIFSKSAGVFAGAGAAQVVAKLCGVSIKTLIKEGALLKKNQRVIELSGKIHSILKAERVLLNLIGHLSGIATQTAEFVRAVRGTKCKIIDTRKTTPLWRELEKAAVLAGGGFNHRFGLDDYILVKENHRRFGNLSRLVNRPEAGGRSRGVKSRASGLRSLGFEIEVRDFDELIEAFDLGAEVAMLDHFTPTQAKKAVQLRNQISPQTFLEASGNMSLKTVRAYAVAGIDTISVGALTHSVSTHDFSLIVI